MERKYCKVISFVLLLFFVITIQHYSNKVIGEFLSLDVRKDSVKIVQHVIPSILDKNLLPAGPQASCQPVICHSTCPSEKKILKNS